MAAQLLGRGLSHGVVVYGNLRLWAERGLVHVEDARDNSYDSFSVRSCLHRVQAHQDLLANSREQLRRNGVFDHAEYDRIQGMIEAMAEVCRQAQEQGMPTDASARRDLVRRRPTTVVVPGLHSSF